MEKHNNLSFMDINDAVQSNFFTPKQLKWFKFGDLPKDPINKYLPHLPETFDVGNFGIHYCQDDKYWVIGVDEFGSDFDDYDEAINYLLKRIINL
ncbi:MAG: hypothetical protein BV457_09565 [Thermoplasmata archaeon M9B1D]|nr:MAG: hypothetical protein BV457_09565 [Thermoplasmata archaeon M9B1D]